MNRTLAVVLIVVAFGLGAGAGAFGLLFATGNVAPSGDTADAVPTLDLDAATPTPAAIVQVQRDVAGLVEQVDGLATQVAALDVADQLSAVEAEIAALNAALAAGADVAAAPTEMTAEPTGTPDVETTEVAATDADESAAASSDPAMPFERALYRISEDDSEARFLIDEVLSGNPITVVGATRRVAGDVIVNFADPASSQVGTIAINARTLQTDNDFRDNAIRGAILQSGQFEFIEFAPTELIALGDAPAGVGAQVTFQLRGDLTVRDVTREVVFDVTVTVDSEEQISGTASTTITREDYNLSFNTPPQVADVGDEVTLEIDFVANLVETT